MHSFDLSMEHITKIEGDASLKVVVKEGKVTEVKFKITEYKRFFTQALQGKPVIAAPQHLARICGTCSNAHIICSIEACENALKLEPSENTKLLRKLTMHGLMIRDHALHLYLFVLPDFYNKDAFLDFDENDPEQHQLLHDGFETKGAGNFLATMVAGRSVHAMYPTIGGFLNYPNKKDTIEAIKKLKAIRPAALRLIEIFKNSPFHFDRQATYMALIPKKGYGYIDGTIKTSKGDEYTEDKYREHLEHTIIPYSQASAYKYDGESYLVGALARINLAKDLLHEETKKSLGDTLDIFPSTDVFNNNLAQAIENLHSIDESIDILRKNVFNSEPLVKKPYKKGIGIGVIEEIGRASCRERV